MTLLEELAQSGVTAEDLEKAASVRLFEKAASAEGIDLASLNQDDVSNLYTHFVGGSPAEEGSDMEKDATIELFEKVAYDEGIDLDELDDEDLGQLYGHFVENVLPEMEEEVEVEEAHAKLAEAEILGRHMARAYVDEMEKEAAGEQQFRGYTGRAGDYDGGAYAPGRTQAFYDKLWGKGSKKPSRSKKAREARAEEGKRARKAHHKRTGGAYTSRTAKGHTTGKTLRGRQTTTGASVADVLPKGAKYRVDPVTGDVSGPDVKARSRKGETVSGQRKGQADRTQALRTRMGDRKWDIRKNRARKALRGVGKHISTHRVPYGLGAAGALGTAAAYNLGQRKAASAVEDGLEAAFSYLVEDEGFNPYEVSYDLEKAASVFEPEMWDIAEEVEDPEYVAEFLLAAIDEI